MPYNDALRQTVEVLVQAGGLDDAAALKQALTAIQAEMVNAARTMSEAGAPAETIAKALGTLAGEYQRITKLAGEFANQKSLSESFVGLPQITEQAGQLADSLTKVDVSLSGLMSSAFKARADDITASLKAQAEAARLVEKVEGDAMRARIEGYARAEQEAEAYQAKLKEAADRTAQALEEAFGKSHADAAKADAEELIAYQAKLKEMFERSGQAAADALGKSQAGRVEGTQALIGEIEEMRRLEAEERRLKDATDAAAAAQAKQAKTADANAGSEIWLKQQIDSLAQALQNLAAHEATAEVASMKTVISARNMGNAFQLTERQIGGISRGVLEFSRGLEDFTVAGPLGALNNIPGIFRAIGDSMQLPIATVNLLTAGTSILATGAYVLYKNWDQVTRAMGLGTIETEAKEMERLGKATEKTAEETARLIRLKEIEAAGKETLTAKTSAQKEQDKVASEAINEFGGDQRNDLVKGLVETQRTRLIAMDKEASQIEFDMGERRKWLESEIIGRARIEGFSDDEIAKRLDVTVKQWAADDPKMRELNAKMETALNRSARDNVIGKATLDPNALQVLINAVETNKGAFGPGAGDLLAGLKRATPEAIAERKELKYNEIVADLDDHHDKLRVKAEAEAKRIKDNDQRVLDKAQQAEHDTLFGGLKKRITDAAEDTEAPIAGRREAIAKALAEALTAKTKDGQTLSPKDIEAIKEAQTDAVRRLNREQGAEDKQGAAGEKKADAAREAAAKKFTPSFEAKIQAEMLENARRIAAGNPVARSADEFNALTMQGLAPALPPEAHRKWLEERVGRDLGRVGGKNVDPTLAHEVVGQAGKHLDERAAKLAGNQATTMDTVADNQMLIAALIQQGMMATAQANAKAQAANGHLRRLGQQGPALGRRGN